MPKNIERELKRRAKLKFGSIKTPRAKAYIYGTIRKIEGRMKFK